MFKVTDKRVVEWPVSINEPQDGGRTKRHAVLASFEVIAQSEQDAIYAKGGTDADLLMRVVQGWRAEQFQDDKGAEIACDDSAKARLFGLPYVRQAFTAAYIELSNGREAARKN